MNDNKTSASKKALNFLGNNAVPIMFIIIIAICLPMSGFSPTFLLNEIVTRLSRNACAPLKAIVNLYRDEQNHIEPMTKADAFPELMKRAFFSQNPSTMAGIMILEKKILNAVDFYTLGCNMEPEAARTAWEGMKGLLAKGSL